MSDTAIEILEKVLRRRYTINRDAILYAVEQALDELQKEESPLQPETLGVTVTDSIAAADQVGG